MKHLKIALAFLAIYLIWGSTFLATRFAVQSIPPFFVSGTRFFLAGVVLFVIGWIRFNGRITARMWLSAAGLGSLFFLICHGGVSWAARHVPSGISALLMSSIAMWTAILELALRTHTRPNRRVMISLVVGFAGIALLVIKPEVLAGSNVGSMGAVVVLVGAFSWALGTVLSRRLPLPDSTVLSSGMQMMCGGGLLLVLGGITGQGAGFRLAAVSQASLMAMLFLTLIGSLVGFTCYLWLLSVCPPTHVATYAYVNPLVAVFLGWAIAGERLTIPSLLASVIVIGSVCAVVTSRGRRQPEAKRSIASGELVEGRI